MKITPELLKKYARQECTENEKDSIEQWLSDTDTIDKEGIPNHKSQEEKLWRNIKKVINLQFQKKEPLKIKFNSKFWSIAASVALLISLFVVQIFFKNDFSTYKTVAGQVQTIILDDSTKVFLNADSQLKVPKQFLETTRTVTLIGEGYFEVAKDSLHPFIVKTEKAKTQVLGTKFNLSAYPDEDVVLTLNEGKVLFSNIHDISKKGIILLPNEQSTLSKGILKKNTVNPNHYNGWIDNKLYFNNESFIAITRKIERVFDVTIQIQNQKLKKQIYKGVYDNPSLKILLEDLSFVLKFSYKTENKIITIY